MELDWLEDFMALSSAGVFARAADARNISQSAFTRRIKNLENWAGTPLFDRSVHPVELTPAGKAFKPTAVETIKALTLTKEDIRDLSFREAEALDFVALHTLAISFFPSWLTGMVANTGPVKTRLFAENFSGCAEAILSGSADFMMCYHHPSVISISDEHRYPSTTIARDTMIAVSGVDRHGNPKFHFEQQEPLPYLSYPPDTFLGRISTVCMERGKFLGRLKSTYENSMSEALKSACLEGHGVAFLPAQAAEREIELGLLKKISQPSFELGIDIKLYRSIDRSRPQLERFWMLAQKS
ncbi:LysR family transcriptional regulator [Cognatishimia sp. SS12]|uniref:LysR family transcriptional regulator n=1 Tax=Cognatishimia sp. SS12 TaxID=2979465 RepID=UPI00232D13F2|nr:LysR family transcriptional regulator [Cognatishimia sp. SS12]MDC0738292.1 LysR family transcriptional regulator [Cognatishimia sp. SS12]